MRFTAKTPRISWSQHLQVAATCLSVVCLALASVAQTTPPALFPPATGTSAPASDDPLVASLVAAEETLLTLTRRLEPLASGLADLRLPAPSPETAALFANQVAVRDLAPPPSPETAYSSPPRLVFHDWPLAAPAPPAPRVDLWRPLLDSVDTFEQGAFQLLHGDHPRGDLWRFESLARFEGLARMKSSEWRSIEARVRLGWERTAHADGTAGDWRITEWTTEAFRTTAAPRRFFAEVLEQAVRPPATAAALRRSGHYEATVKYYREGTQKPPYPYFAPISVNHKEGVAVADVNGDGLDDLYITVRVGKNLLLVNRGDGTFSEEAAAHKLDLPGHTTCSLFADFDNDGDLDALLGRSLLRTTYLENRGGVFFQHPIPKFMPMAVISMAAADYNGDGLLDVYLCTYRPAAPAGSGTGGGYGQMSREGDFDWPDEFFPPDQAREFRRRVAEHRQKVGPSALDQIGPPNLLLVNRGGGRFEPAPENATVGLWRNSLQATWCDYNQDGRPDLYIPNDWGMNVLFRNDGTNGFKDVTAEAGLTYYGFSMGASWCDFDHDGRDDLYISNMHSEAGLRLTARLPGVEPALVQSALGNYLYRQGSDGRFTMAAGLQPPALTVMRAGWSWGGCFADFDNDTFPDLYVMSGYFTAPAELASGLDLESNLWRTMVRADPRYARPSFRHSPEWKRTPPPDRRGPEIDARLAGVERVGDRFLVHSLHGGERNRYFANLGGSAFADVSALSGLDDPADSRGFGILDYDRDGWQDVALVNANQPLLELFHNEMPAAGLTGGVIALRFRGGNRTAAPSSTHTARDGFGARVTVDLGETRLVREHRCGEGWSTQNSATLLVGIGAHTRAASVSVRWPSGRVQTARSVAEGTLLTVFEDASEAPAGDGFTRQDYRLPRATNAPSPAAAPPPRMFALRASDTAARPARLRVYSGFTTSQESFVASLPALRMRHELLRPEGVDFVAVPLDPADDDNRLAAFNRRWRPPVRLVNVPAARRAEAASVFAATAPGHGPGALVSVITDDAGHVLATQEGLPSVSTLRRWLRSR